MPRSSLESSEISNLAERIASYLSYDAATWRPEYLDVPVASPIRLAFDWTGAPRPYSSGLLSALDLLLSRPFVTNDYPNGAAVVRSADAADDGTDVRVNLTERWHQDAICLYYELEFTRTDGMFAGFFPLRVDAS